MEAERCMHLGMADAPWALVSVTPIPWSNALPDAPPRTFYACAACATGALLVVRGHLDREAPRRAAEAERKLAAICIYAGDSEVVSGNALRAILQCPPDDRSPE